MVTGLSINIDRNVVFAHHFGLRNDPLAGYLTVTFRGSYSKPSGVNSQQRHSHTPFALSLCTSLSLTRTAPSSNHHPSCHTIKGPERFPREGHGRRRNRRSYCRPQSGKSDPLLYRPSFFARRVGGLLRHSRRSYRRILETCSIILAAELRTKVLPRNCNFFYPAAISIHDPWDDSLLRSRGQQSPFPHHNFRLQSLVIVPYFRMEDRRRAN